MKSINEQNDKTMKPYTKPAAEVVKTDLLVDVADDLTYHNSEWTDNTETVKGNTWDIGYDETDSDW